MSLKKILMISAAGIAALGLQAAIAGGPDTFVAHAPVDTGAGIYVEGNIGYVYRPWKHTDTVADGLSDLTHDTDNTFKLSTHRATGGFAAGGDIGYQFNHYLGAEIGGYYLPQYKVDFSGKESLPFDIRPYEDIHGQVNFNESLNYKVTSWLAYGAAKLTVPVYQNFSVFGKIGVGYTHNDLDVSGDLKVPGHDNVGDAGTADLPVSFSVKEHHWTPVFAFGGQYAFSDNLYVLAQYMRVPGYHRTVHSNSDDHLHIQTPNINLFTAGVGYKFAL